jgi:adenine-specific DNA-methyltransferase
VIQILKNFNEINFYKASINFLKELNIPINEITTQSIDVNDIFEKPIESFNDVNDIYAVGMIDDNYFKDNEAKFDINIAKKYDGILIFAVELKTEAPTRKILADISRAFNKEYHYTPVIVIFKYGNYISLSNTQRQSYKREQEGEKVGKVTILRDINIDNPHRGHIDILNKMRISSKTNSYESLYKYWQEVFDISILNKSFYEELFKWYTNTLDTIKLPNDDGTHSITTTNTIRLITRIIFIWFLKEKGLIPNNLFDKKYLDDILEYKDNNNSTYYKVILQNLFFATLNTEISKRKFRDINNFQGKNKDYGNQDVYRYERFIKSNKIDEWKELFSFIPFVNGGLFENLDIINKNKFISTLRIDGFSDRKDNKLIVPDDIFFGKDGLITILNSYKFTIAENTPIEEDVALDPELLGKVFENLLASYNPETNTTKRHDTGSYYTPREIVDYMVDSSLINHFKQILDDSFEDKKELDKKLHLLLSYEDKQPFEDDIVNKLILAIDTLKILDPAVGSGAYPMGILHKMVHILHKLDPNNKNWLNLQLEKAKKETIQIFENDDNNIKEDKLKEIHDSFDITLNHPDYARKLYLIENTIFGIDIQNIAIQIAKLRFFISLIVDQNVNQDKENLGIRPLPNLEFKLMQGNSLLETINGFDPLDETNIVKNKNNKTRIQNLKRNFHKFYKASSKIQKNKIKDEIKQDIDVLFKKVLINYNKELQQTIKENDIFNTSKAVQKRHQEQLSNKTLIEKILKEYDEFDASTEIFLYKIYFAEVFANDGFDIVIGNPPYIRQEKIKDLKPKLQNEPNKFLSYNGTADIYIYFFEKGYKLLKPNGILSYITSNKYTRAKYGKEFRKFILENTNILEYIDFNGVKIFESATVDTSILTYRKSIKENNNFTYCDIDDKYKKNSYLYDFVFNKGFEYNQKDLSIDSFSFATLDKLRIKKQIEKIGIPLKDWGIKINYGIKTGFNEAFIIDTKTKDELIAKDSKSAEIIKPLLRGKDINKYSYQFVEHWLIATFPSLELDINNYIAIKEYLETFGKRLEQSGSKGSRKKTKHKWFETQDTIKYFQDFEKHKFVWASIGKTEYSFVPKGFYLLDTNYFMAIDNKYILALLNSNLLIIYNNKKDTPVGNQAYRHYKYNLEELPIPKIQKEKQKHFEVIVDYILFTKEQNMNNEYSQFEAVIDNMVYDLYFEEDMKKSNCFISDAVRNIDLQPFHDNLSDEFKTKYVKTVYDVFKNNKDIQRGLIFSRNIEVVKIINGD